MCVIASSTAMTSEHEWSADPDSTIHVQYQNYDPDLSIQLLLSSLSQRYIYPLGPFRWNLSTILPHPGAGGYVSFDKFSRSNWYFLLLAVNKWLATESDPLIYRIHELNYDPDHRITKSTDALPLIKFHEVRQTDFDRRYEWLTTPVIEIIVRELSYAYWCLL